MVWEEFKKEQADKALNRLFQIVTTLSPETDEQAELIGEAKAIVAIIKQWYK